MKPEDSFEALRQQLVGRLVTDRQLAGNSLSIWVGTEAGTRRGWTIWLEPSWHVIGPDSLLAGSMQAQDEENESGWKAVTNAIDTLVGRKIEHLSVDPVTGDLTVGMSGGIIARTFASDPRETFHWRIRTLATESSVVGSPNGMTF
jgi:hypothetical protein